MALVNGSSGSTRPTCPCDGAVVTVFRHCCGRSRPRRTEVESVFCLEKDLVPVGRWGVWKVGGRRNAPLEWVVRARDFSETMDPETNGFGPVVADRGNDWKECACLAHGAVMFHMLVW